MNEIIDVGTRDNTALQLWPVNIPINRDVADVDQEAAIKAAIKAAEAKYSNIEITDNATYKTIAEGLSIFRSARTSVEKRRKELGEKPRKLIAEINGTAKKITELMAPVEADLKEKKKVEDDKAEVIRLELEHKEKARVAGIEAKINEIRALVPKVPTSSDDLSDIIFDLSDMEPTEIDFRELVGMAVDVKNKVLAGLNQLLSDRLKWEDEEGARKAEIVRIKEQKKENDRLEAERKKEAEKDAAKIKAEKAKLDAERKALDEEKIQDRLFFANGLEWNGEFLFSPDDPKTPVITRADLLTINGDEYREAREGFFDQKKAQAEIDRNSLVIEGKTTESEVVAGPGERPVAKSSLVAKHSPGEERKAETLTSPAEEEKKDREDLLALADFFEKGVCMPEVASEKAKMIIAGVLKISSTAAEYIRREVGEWT